MVVLNVMCTLALKPVEGGMDPLITHYSTWLSWILTSRTESRSNLISLRVDGMEIPGGSGPLIQPYPKLILGSLKVKSRSIRHEGDPSYQLSMFTEWE